MKSSKRQSVGIVPLKHIIKWLYPEAVAAFDGCAEQHDRDYKKVDWSRPNPTAAIDQKFYQCCLVAANNDPLLLDDAALFFKVCGKWGRMRRALWKIGIRY